MIVIYIAKIYQVQDIQFTHVCRNVWKALKHIKQPRSKISKHYIRLCHYMMTSHHASFRRRYIYLNTRTLIHYLHWLCARAVSVWCIHLPPPHHNNMYMRFLILVYAIANFWLLWRWWCGGAARVELFCHIYIEAHTITHSALGFYYLYRVSRKYIAY